MPDIAMCINFECSFRKSCYRYTATADSLRQSYAYFRPKMSGCEWMIRGDTVDDTSILDENNKNWSDELAKE